MASDCRAPSDSLRLLVCGSVDDGKSTLLGRLLWDLGAVPADEADRLLVDSERLRPGTGPDYSLLLDGLEAEREQAITIDLAWRQFSHAGRRYRVADAPGHEQYTHNMASGASSADAAILLLDVRHGLLAQSRRHLVIAALMGVRHVALAINKMDLVDWAPAAFEGLAAEATEFATRAGHGGLCCVPTSGLTGDNVSHGAAAAPWYRGPTLLQWLQGLPAADAGAEARALRLPVQNVLRGADGKRWLAGRLVAGTLVVGDRVRMSPSGLTGTVKAIALGAAPLAQASAGRSVTVQLEQALDVARGDVLCHEAAPVAAASQFQASLVWLHEAPLLRGRSYGLQLGTASALATVSPVRHRLDTDTLQAQPAERLERNQIGEVELELDRPLAFEPYASVSAHPASRALGGFILVDRVDGHTVGAGTIHFALRRAGNLRWQAMDVDRAARQRLNGHRGGVVWLTGLSGAGKSTLADRLERRLHALGVHTYVLDGDNVRHGLNKDLGFTDQDRVENIRRVAEVARLMVDAGLVVIAALIAPFEADRAMARSLFAPGDFLEVHVDVALSEAERRDPKGLYRKARAGQLSNFTGIDSPYEPPPAPELRIDTGAASPDVAVEQLLALLGRHRLLPA